MKFVIFDIDNCISNDARRQERLPAKLSDDTKRHTISDTDFEAYHEGAALDKPMNEHLVNGHITATEDDIVILFITARPERYRKKTEWWLREKFPRLQAAGGPEWQVLMRPRHNMASSPDLKVALFENFAANELGANADGWAEVIMAYDDREDVLKAYRAKGVANLVRLDPEGAIALDDIRRKPLGLVPGPDEPMGVPEILEGMAQTFRERGAIYGDNWALPGKVLAALFGGELPEDISVTDTKFGLFYHMINKICRLSTTGLSHEDSAHDIAVYAAKLEELIRMETK